MAVSAGLGRIHTPSGSNLLPIALSVGNTELLHIALWTTDLAVQLTGSTGALSINMRMAASSWAADPLVMAFLELPQDRCIRHLLKT